MKELLAIAGIIITATALLLTGVAEGIPISHASISTDKGTYLSREQMLISLNISSRVAANVTIDIKGIGNRLEISQERHLQAGNNNLTFTYTTPECYGCAGISPGMYNITAYITYDNNTIESPVYWIKLDK